MPNWWWKRRARLADRRATAERELEKSRRLLEETRRRTDPIRQADMRNHFSDIVRRALSQGWEANGRGHGSVTRS